MLKSRTEISNKMRLLKLPPIIKDSLRTHKITYGHARALVSIKESKKIISVFYQIIKNNLSVRETEKIIRLKSAVSNKKNIKNLSQSEKKLQHYLKSKVAINIRKNDKGKILIDFNSILQLKKIIKLILNE